MAKSGKRMATGEENMSDTYQAEHEAQSKLYLATVKAGRVQRWHTMDTNHTQNVADHTYGVLHTLLFITENECSRDLLVAAMFHDVAEHITGDIPHPYKSRLKKLFGRMEDDVHTELGIDPLADLTEDEKVTLKQADLIEMGIWGTGELISGNANGAVILQNVLKALDGMTLSPNAQMLVSSFEVNFKRAQK
jgi:5'-deoxynucleotidase YfbR-like HD superfamily hydrolase